MSQLYQFLCDFWPRFDAGKLSVEAWELKRSTSDIFRSTVSNTNIHHACYLFQKKSIIWDGEGLVARSVTLLRQFLRFLQD